MALTRVLTQEAQGGNGSPASIRAGSLTTDILLPPNCPPSGASLSFEVGALAGRASDDPPSSHRCA